MGVVKFVSRYVIVIGFLLMAGLGYGQTYSEVIVSVNWPSWSSENRVEIYSPSLILIATIDNGYAGGADDSYSETLNLGCLQDLNNYRIIMYDNYGDGWNGSSNVTITSDGNTVFSNNGPPTNGGNRFMQVRRFNVSGGSCVVCSIPTAPTAIDGQICIGSSAILSASGAGSGDVYKWYATETSVTPLKTSVDDADNTFTTPNLSVTTNYWVSIETGISCESTRTIVTATYPANSPDSQATAGTNTWIGHVYDGTNTGIAYNGNFTNYYGTVTEPEEFDESFGGNYNCYSVNSVTLGNRSIYTETFSVRYRMNSTKKGLYVVDLGSDDGSRLQVDSELVYDDWNLQAFGSGNPRVLISLTGSSPLIYDFYENTGGNRVRFNNLTKILDNNLTTNIIQNICSSIAGLEISGDSFGGTLPSGISLSGTGYQWAYSTTSTTGPWIDIPGATAATFTPSGLNAPFNAGGTFYVLRKALLSSTNNVAPDPYVATNISNVATVNVATTNTWTGATNNDWNTASNWSCGEIPTISSNVLIPSPLASTNFPEIYNIDANGLANNIELEIGATLTIFDNYIEIAGALLLNGIIDLSGEGQLIQNNGSTLDPLSEGSIERDQQGVKSAYAYNYWGSPVEKMLITSPNNYSSKLKDILYDGDVDLPVNFIGGLNGALGDLVSPISIANRWIYKYTKSTNTGGYSDWQYIGSTTDINAGQGFSMKGPDPAESDISSTKNYTFKGLPNNGTITLPVIADNQYLLANPYPSAIDLGVFIAQNHTIIKDDVILLWEQYAVTNHKLSGYEGAYWQANGTGAVGIPEIPGEVNQSPTSSSSKTPGYILPVAQGFFVNCENGGNLVFENSQRVFQEEAIGVSVFMKESNTKTSTESLKSVDIRPKIRIGFKAPSVAHRQLLFGIVKNTTDGVDWGYDAEMGDVLEDDIYWDLADGKYIIQATNSISDDKELPLGIVMSETGLVTIKIDALENIDAAVELFIKDNTTLRFYKINDKPFEMNLEAGEYLNRFSLTFKLNNNEEVAEEITEDEGEVGGIEIIAATNLTVFMDNNAGELKIRNTSNSEITEVKLFNSLGQLMGAWNQYLNKTDIALPVNVKATGMYIVQLQTSTGVITKKVLIE